MDNEHGIDLCAYNACRFYVGICRPVSVSELHDYPRRRRRSKYVVQSIIPRENFTPTYIMRYQIKT